MKTSAKVTATAIVIGLAAMGLGQVIWPLAPGLPTPTLAQLPFLAFLDLAQSLLFGLGVALLIWGWPVFRGLSALTARLRAWCFASVVWLFISWWPHIGFHRSMGEDLWSLIFIDYVFHFTIIIASLILMRAFLAWSRPPQ